MDNEQITVPTPPKEVTPTKATEQPDHQKQERHPASPALYKLRKYFIYVLVGGLIISALIAIIAVLAGNMSGLIGKSILTVVVIIVHSLVALGFISITSNRQPNIGSAVVVNTLFGITVLSLITAMLGVWEIITDDILILRQYSVFFSAFITSLMLYGLFQATENDKPTLIARNTAVGSSLVSFLLLLPILYGVDNLPDFYFRVLVATYIVVGVSIVITVIFHWYYMSKHPEQRHDSKVEEPMSITKMVGRLVLIFIGIWIAAAFFSGIFRAIMDTQQPRNQQPSYLRRVN